jgi:hypothetical protein
MSAAMVISSLASVGSAGAQQRSEPQAWDGQTLSQQQSDTQAMFTAV